MHPYHRWLDTWHVNRDEVERITKSYMSVYNANGHSYEHAFALLYLMTLAAGAVEMTKDEFTLITKQIVKLGEK